MRFSFNRTLAVGAAIYRLDLTVKNKGDDAYNAKLMVTIPKGIKTRNILKVVGDKVGCGIYVIRSFKNNVRVWSRVSAITGRI